MEDVRSRFVRLMPALQRQGWNQKRVAEFLGMHADQFSKLLCGRWIPRHHHPKLRAKLRTLERRPKPAVLLGEESGRESSPCAFVARREKVEAVWRALGRLKPGEAMVVQKIFLEGHAFVDLAWDRAADEARLREVYRRALKRLAALPEFRAALS